MVDQAEHPEDAPEAGTVAEPVPSAAPIVTVRMPRRTFLDDDDTMALPADAASHWDRDAWNRC